MNQKINYFKSGNILFSIFGFDNTHAYLYISSQNSYILLFLSPKCFNPFFYTFIIRIEMNDQKLKIST